MIVTRTAMAPTDASVIYEPKSELSWKEFIDDWAEYTKDKVRPAVPFVKVLTLLPGVPPVAQFLAGPAAQAAFQNAWKWGCGLTAASATVSTGVVATYEALPDWIKEIVDDGIAEGMDRAKKWIRPEASEVFVSAVDAREHCCVSLKECDRYIREAMASRMFVTYIPGPITEATKQSLLDRGFVVRSIPVEPNEGGLDQSPPRQYRIVVDWRPSEHETTLTVGQ